MYRTRDEGRWNVPFHHYSSFKEFLEHPTHRGVHTFNYKNREIDILLESRESNTTLIVFSAAIAFTRKHTPYFSGRALAEKVGANLIAISEPMLYYSGISVAWYLGDNVTGPLRPVLTASIRHILDQLGSTKTILFGASGGGFAAAHLASDFPDSIGLLLNPRLSLERSSKSHMQRYFEHAHQTKIDGELAKRHKTLLSNYAPLNIEDQAKTGLNHDLLIYQNLLDASFIQHQFLPFMSVIRQDIRLRIRFENDGPGHVPVPSQRLRQIVQVLAKTTNTQDAIKAAGFAPQSRASIRAIEKLPRISRDFISITKQEATSKTKNEYLREQNTYMMDAKLNLEDRNKALKTQNSNLSKRNQSLERQNQSLSADIVSLNDQKKNLSHEKSVIAHKITEEKKYVLALEREILELGKEPPFSQRIWRLLPQNFRKRVRYFFKRK